MEINYTKDDLMLLENFLDDVSEGLESMESDILSLENNRDDEVINSLFRTIHSIKGTCGYVNLNHIRHLSHEIEFLVDDYRNNKIQITSEGINLLLNSADMINTMFSHLKKEFASPREKKDGTVTLVLPDLLYENKVEEIKKFRVQAAHSEKKLDNGSNEKDAVIPVLEKQAAVKFSKRTAGALENIKTALNDFSAVDQREKSIKDFKIYSDILVETADGINYSTLSAKARELQNMFDFLQAAEPEMAVSLLEALQNNLGSLAKLINHPALLDAPLRDPQSRTRTSDIDTSSVRVPGERLDRFMNLIGELTVSKNAFAGLANELRVKHGLPEVSKNIKDAGNIISRISEDLQISIMEIRMMPVKIIFSRFQRMIRDLSKKTGKPLHLVVKGEETELDKTVIEKIGDPLVHMIRNSADHGIESSEERTEKGKPKVGTIELEAISQGQTVMIKVTDDGKGLSREKIAKKAMERGLISENTFSSMSDEEVYKLILAPGFSMKKEVSDLSGRGVGMDVVKSNIEKIGGTVSIDSQENVSTTITLRIPLTLTVTRGLQIEAAGELFILPLENVIETVKVKSEQIRSFKNNSVIAHRNSVLRIIDLADVLKIQAGNQTDSILSSLIILKANGETIALKVNRFHKEVDILIKPLEDTLGKLEMISGASIQNDGRIVLILNPEELI